MPRVFQPVANTVELTVQGQRDGQLIENKFYAKGANPITDIMVAALATVVDTWAGTTLLPNCPDNYQYLRTVARDLTTAASFESIANAAGGGVGGIDGDNKPNNVTIAVHRNTGLSGAKAKSRIYWPAIADSMLSGVNTLDAGVGASLEGALNTLRGDIIADTSNTWEYGYVQRVIAGVKLTAGNFIVVFAHSLTDLILDSMRDRLPGHGV